MLEVTSAINPLAPDIDKDSPKYGLKLMAAAVTKWQNGWNGESRLSRKNRFDYNRAFSMGKQPMQEYLDILDLDGEMSVVNIPKDPLPIAIPFLNRLKDRYNQREEVIQCDSIDPFTQNKKKRAKDEAVFKLKNKEAIQGVQQEAGVPLEEFSDDDPQSQAEINIEFGFNYKERVEVVMEDLINIVFYENDMYGVIKDRIFDDLINCGVAATQVYIDGTGRIKIRVVKPENLIVSYNEWNDFRDWQYIGDINYLSIMEVRLKYPGKISEEKLYQLSLTLVGKYGNPAVNGYTWSPQFTTALARPYDSWRVPVVQLDFKTLYNLKKSVITDKFGKESIVDNVEDADRRKGELNIQELESNPYYVQYTGAYIMDTEYVLEWGLSKNMVKPQDNLQEIVSSYVVYMYNNTEMSNKPLMEIMIPTIKEMQLAKLQQLKIIAAAAPDGYDVDIATMSDIDLGGGYGTLTPLQLLSIYKQSGMKYYKSIPDEGIEGGSRRVPIMANNVPFSAKLEQLSQIYNNGYDQLTRLISNNLDQGNITNQATGLKVLQEAKDLGQSTSNFIYNSFLNILQRTAKVSQLRGWDILVFGKKFGIISYDGYRKALGNNKIEYIKLEADDDFDKTCFDVQIRTTIGDAQMQYLEQNMQAALTEGKIEFSDTLDIRELAVTNVKYASYMMAKRIDMRKKEAQTNAMQLAQQNEAAAVSGAQAKTQGDLALEAAKAANKKEEDEREQTRLISVEEAKFNGILKAEIVKSVLAIPGATMADIPSFVFEGVPLEKAVNHANALAYLQTLAQMEQQNQIDQQAKDQAAQEAQQQGQQQQDPNQQQQSPQAA